MRNAALILYSLGLALSVTAWAADPFVGTWKFDPKQSKSSGNQPRSEIYRIAAKGSAGVALTKEYVSSNGVPHHITGTCKFDGRDYPVTGHPLPDATRALKRIDAHTWEMTLRSAGKPAQETREVVSNDGNTLTVTGTVTVSGQIHDFTMIYTRQ